MNRRFYAIMGLCPNFTDINEYPTADKGDPDVDDSYLHRRSQATRQRAEKEGIR